MYLYGYHAYFEHFLRNLPYFVVALIGIRQLRRRWVKNPEANALICWGLGLVVANSLATISMSDFLQSRAYFLSVFDKDVDPSGSIRFWSAILSLLYLFVDVVVLWAMIRGALRLLDAPEEKPGRLNSRQAHALLPLTRVQKGLFRSEEMVITEREVLFRRITHGGTGSQVSQRFELDPVPDKATPGLKVIIEQVGLVGPERHMRRLRFVAPGSRRNFTIPVADYSNVRDVLEELLPGRVVEKQRPRRSSWDWMLLLATILFILMNLEFEYGVLYRVLDWSFGIGIRSQENRPDSNSPSFLVGFVITHIAGLGPLVVLLVYLVRGWRALYSKNRPPLPAVRVRRRSRRSREPFHSRPLGWILKIGSFLLTICWLGLWFVVGWASETKGYSAGILSILNSLMLSLSVGTMTLGHHWCQTVFTPGAHKDPRPPFLFLRSFDDDDRVTLQPNSWLAELFGIPSDFGRRANRRSLLRLGMQFHPIRWFRMFLGLPGDTVEQLLAIGLKKDGPLVAIGQPGETEATLGAHRMYVPDEEWQSVVRDYLGKSAGVVLQPALTDGVIWEIRRTFETVPKAKVLLSLVNYQDRPQAYEGLWLLLHEEFGVDLPRDVPFLGRPSFVYFDANAAPYLQALVYKPVCLWPLVGNAVDVKTTLTPYLSSLASGEPCKPAPVVPSSRTAVFASILLSISLLFLIPLGLRALAVVIFQGISGK